MGEIFKMGQTLVSHLAKTEQKSNNEATSATSSLPSTTFSSSPRAGLEKVRRFLWPRDYVLTSATRFAFADLREMKQGTYQTWLQKVIKICKKPLKKAKLLAFICSSLLKGTLLLVFVGVS